MKEKFFERQGISLVKDGDDLLIYKSGIVGPTDMIKDFFKRALPEVISSHEVLQTIKPKKPKQMVLGIKGVGFRLVIDKENAKIIRKAFYEKEGKPVAPRRPFAWP